MLRRFRWLALAGVVATAALVVPTAAFAGGCPSATSIYSECSTNTSAKGSHSSGKPRVKPSGGTSTPTGQIVWPAPPAPVSKVTKRTIAKSGKDKAVLNNLTRNSTLVDSTRLKLASGPVGTASFDLGTGPTLLVALLAGTVLVLLGAGGVRSWRNRHRV